MRLRSSFTRLLGGAAFGEASVSGAVRFACAALLSSALLATTLVSSECLAADDDQGPAGKLLRRPTVDTSQHRVRTIEGAQNPLPFEPNARIG